MRDFRISVLMGIYNCASTLDEALESLYSQTYQEFKVIMCDDGSKDNTFQVAQKHAKEHDNVVLISNKENMGLNYTLNHCLEYADTEYIARMDGDDISLPERFQREIEFLDANPDYSIVSTPMIYFDEEGDFKVGKAIEKPQKMDFIHGTPICHAPCMARTADIKSVDGYSVDKRLLRVEDYHLWMKMYAAGFKAYNLQKPYYKMRDNREAKRRRNWQNRKNEMYCKSIGFKLLGLPFYTQIYALRPLLVHITPDFIYNFYHRK